ncbi:EPIDERMAL PATTERNING FACTOR-like protein 1 [Linum perenne]
MAVQVPTQPSHTRVQPGSSQRVIDDTELYESYYNPPAGNRYSNYKPLGWKCRCGDHLYNP